MSTRICRHPLRIVPHAPKWLACDTCHADFPHRQGCPGLGSPGCLLACMGGAEPDPVVLLEVAFQLPAYERTDHA